MQFHMRIIIYCSKFGKAHNKYFKMQELKASTVDRELKKFCVFLSLMSLFLIKCMRVGAHWDSPRIWENALY